MVWNYKFGQKSYSTLLRVDLGDAVPEELALPFERISLNES